MAEIIVSAFFSVFIEKLGSEALKKIARSTGIESELKKLKRSLTQINNLLDDASQKEITDKAVKGWLNGLQQLAYDIDDVLDDLATEAMRRELRNESGTTTSKVIKLIPRCCTNFKLSARMHAKLDDIVSKIQELGEEKDKLGLEVKGESPKVLMNRKLETSLVDASSVVGRASDTDALLHNLLRDNKPTDKNFSIVPIVGMGGVGKTTLAKLLYNEMQGKDHFELKAWVCVSDEFDILKISNTIFQSVGGENKEFSDLNLLQTALREKISNKRFLFVLDDVWSERFADWELLARPFLAGASGSKIIMTTRKLSLLNQLDHDEIHNLSVLSGDDAVTLFCQNALAENNFDSHPTLQQHGEGIVQKCHGLPLALTAIGRSLKSKRDEKQWREVLNSDIWSLGSIDDIAPAIRLSYLDLPASLKLLFAYCSLFPKDYMFDIKELVLLWMAEGFLHQPTTSKTMESLGHDYFQELCSRSFFQRAPDEKELFVMHDIMSDLATSVAGEFFSRLDIKMMKERRNEDSEKYRHISFVCDDYMVYEKFKSLKGAKSLRTFLAVPSGEIRGQQTFYLSSKILGNLLHEFPLLRVLNLSQLSVREVPESIGSMKHLRYLSLSKTKITCLPDSVCNLYNLQTLILSHCADLVKLPKSFSKLKNLRHFDISDTPLLTEMPLGICEIKSLQSLTKFIIEGDNGLSIADLKYLNDLRGEIRIRGLDKVQSALQAHGANLSQKKISTLDLVWSDVFDGSRNGTLEKEVLKALKPDNDYLEDFQIESYGGIELPNWIGDPLFLRLTCVVLYDCKKCTSLPLLGQLPSLIELCIKGMDEVKVVGSELLGTGISFPSLKSLEIGDMMRLEVFHSGSGVVFPCLKKLKLYSCPNLVKVSVEALPSLRVLTIESCRHEVLRSLVCVASSVTKLEIKNISGLNDQLWGGVSEYLRKVVILIISECNEISECKILVNLRRLTVRGCSNLVSLGEKDEEDDCGRNLTSLGTLEVQNCRSLVDCTCPNSVEYFMIESCDSLTSVSFPTGEQKIHSLSVTGCKNILAEELVINSTMQKSGLLILSQWICLKSITNLNCFIHLRGLTIVNCPNLASFPDQELPNLTVLEFMSISNCRNLDSFPRGIWPPKLDILWIGGLKKPMSEWGEQNFPASLSDVQYFGERVDYVSSFSQLSHLFPSSLETLTIGQFEKLESVSTGIQHLTSLKHLTIWECPRTTDLPENLLPSLLSLTIRECPNLKKMCTTRGAYRTLISGIPKLEIDDELHN